MRCPIIGMTERNKTEGVEKQDHRIFKEKPEEKLRTVPNYSENPVFSPADMIFQRRIVRAKVVVAIDKLVADLAHQRVEELEERIQQCREDSSEKNVEEHYTECERNLISIKQSAEKLDEVYRNSLTVLEQQCARKDTLAKEWKERDKRCAERRRKFMLQFFSLR